MARTFVTINSMKNCVFFTFFIVRFDAYVQRYADFSFGIKTLVVLWRHIATVARVRSHLSMKLQEQSKSQLSL